MAGFNGISDTKHILALQKCRATIHFCLLVPKISLYIDNLGPCKFALRTDLNVPVQDYLDVDLHWLLLAI